MTSRNDRLCVDRGSDVCERHRYKCRRRRGSFVGFCIELIRRKSTPGLALRQLGTPVSMALTPTETGGKKHNAKLHRGKRVLRDDVATER